MNYFIRFNIMIVILICTFIIGALHANPDEMLHALLLALNAIALSVSVIVYNVILHCTFTLCYFTYNNKLYLVKIGLFFFPMICRAYPAFTRDSISDLMQRDIDETLHYYKYWFCKRKISKLYKIQILNPDKLK